MSRTRLGSTLVMAVSALIIGALLGSPAIGRADSGGPTNTTAPSISGTAQDGQTLTADPGAWDGSPTSYAYAWNRCDTSGGSCTAIAGAAASTYKATADDVGHTLTVTVTAANAGGSSQATSDATAVVSPATAPTSTGAPVISGTVEIGSTLTVDDGSWSGNPAGYTFAWSRCDASGGNCSKVVGATKSTYVLTAADSGTTLRASVTATNDAGSTVATSVPTAVVPAPTGCPAGTGAIQIADLQQPARLMIAHATVRPNVIAYRTNAIQITIRVTACGGRPVQGAQVLAVAIPYDQFAGNDGTTGSDGTVTIAETRESGFPAAGRQRLLAVLVRASKPGAPLLGGVSTRRTVAFNVAP